jgi:Flp pilus assembly protein TadG
MVWPARKRQPDADAPRVVRRAVRSLAPARLRRAEDGAAVAEFAVVVPIFLILLLGTLEFARGFWIVNTLQFAVEQGARYTMLAEVNGVSRPNTNNCSTSTTSAFATQIQSLMQADLSAALLGSATPHVTPGPCPPRGSLPALTFTITASYSFSSFLSAIVPNGPLNLQQGEVVTTPLT